MDDLISRQVAIDALNKEIIKRRLLDDINDGMLDEFDTENILRKLPSAQPEITDEQAIEHLQGSGWMQNHDKQMYEMGLRKQLADDSDSYDALLPSAQPEPLTDKEQRIFLSAMSREEEVCKQVDDVWRDCRDPYEDSLVRTCHEITRKVKGALWT